MGHDQDEALFALSVLQDACQSPERENDIRERDAGCRVTGLVPAGGHGRGRADEVLCMDMMVTVGRFSSRMSLEM